MLATYPNHDIAAATYRYGKGRVGLVGPDPEADESWNCQCRLTNPTGIRPHMACDLIDATMKRWRRVSYFRFARYASRFFRACARIARCTNGVQPSRVPFSPSA